MTKRDIDRYIRKRTGITTPAEREAQRDRDIRYRTEPDLSAIEPTSYPRGFFLPPGFNAANITDVTVPVTNRTVARYLGQAPGDLANVTLRVNVTTAAATITWAEIGIATSLTAVMGLPVDLIPAGFTNVATTFNSTGLKDVDVSVAISRGAHVWALWGQQATTLYVLRAGIGDGITSGFVQFADTTRPSTMANPTTFAITAGSANNAWIGVQW